MYYQTFKVSGFNDFPVDMLRYDSCFPSRQEDVTTIMDSLQEPAMSWDVEIARYTHLKDDQPTVARWQSFGCKVSNVQTRRG